MRYCGSCWHQSVCKDAAGTGLGCVHYAPFSSFVFIPCALGDTVFVVTRDGVLSAVVDKMTIRPGNELRVRVVVYCEGVGLVWSQQQRYYTGEDFGKKVFLRVEDAQCAFEARGSSN